MLESSEKKRLEEENLEFGYTELKKAGKVWAWIGIFMVCLMISMPFYSANVLATSISVSENYGTGGYDGFLDAESDTWTLGVSISNLDDDIDVLPEQVILDVSGSQIPFSSCSGDSLETTCEFQSVLSDGISEGTYSFEVILYDLEEDPSNESVGELGTELASDTDSIVAEGSEPSITFTNVYQSGEEIYLDFTVNDKPDGSCVGLSEVEIIDSDSGEVLEEIILDEETWLGVCEFDYVNDGDTSGVLSAQLSDEGTRHFKIRATDFLGHTETGTAKSFDTDFVAPEIEHGTLSLLDFGDYVGSATETSDVSINVTECGELEEVTATSDDISFYSQSADCDMIDNDECLWECVWDDLSINADGSSVSAEITAIDEIENEATATVTATFTSDTTAPVIDFFGTEFLYSDYSYVSTMGSNKIYALITESGSGIDEDHIAANLQAVGGGSSGWTYPDECYEGEEYDYVCYWTISNAGSSGSTTTKEINLRLVKDLVGNEGELFSQEIVVDGVQPKVYEMEMYGFSAIGEKDFFQSNDDLIIKTTIYESSGLVVYVDADDIVMDAESKYMYGTDEEQDDGTTEYVPSGWDGWAIFTEEDCARDNESNWECEFQVDSIKSGYDDDADLEIYVTDTSGNEANWNYMESDAENAEGSYGEYSIEIFALDEETQPDFWEVSGTPDPLGFVDLEIVHLTYPQINMAVKLRNDVNAEASLIELDECVPDSEDEDADFAPTISRSLMYGGITSSPSQSPKLNLVLEFEPFESKDMIDLTEYDGDEFDEIEVDYVCNLRVYSIIDETALNYAEQQEVTVSVPFAYSALGGLDENIDSMLYDAVDNGGFKFLDVIGKINTILKWIQWGGNIYRVLMELIEFISYINIGLDEVRKSPGGYFFVTTECLLKTSTEKTAIEVLQKFGIVFEFLSCNPAASSRALGLTGEGSESGPAVGAYAQYQETVLKTWRQIKSWGLSNNGGVFTAVYGDASLYDNIVISLIGLCLPGVVYNLEKMRQIECTYIKCLGQAASTGVTTVDVCTRSKSYMYCKYILGEVMDVLPLDILTFFADMILGFIKDPLGLVFTIISAACSSYCSLDGKAKKFCDFMGYFFKVLEMASNIIGVVTSFKSTQYDVCNEAGVKEIMEEIKDKNSADDDEESVTTDNINSGAEEATA
jgi:hypothetical protein